MSFVQYNVQSIINRLDVLQTELFEFDILAFSETWLNQSVSTDDLLFQSFNRPERKDRVEDSHGGVMIYVKEGLHYKRRDDLEIRGIECIWIEVANHNKQILFALFLAHLSQRLIGELIVYTGIRRLSVVRPSVRQHFQTTSPLKP